MSIIYEPQQVFNVRNAVSGALQHAAGFAALDFVSGAGKPWAYYVGLAFGGAGLATGIPGAAATIYAIGDSMDFWIFKSPDGSELRWFLNGVAQTTIDTYAATAVWELVQDVLLTPDQTNEVQFVNYAASVTPGATGIPWLALGDIEIFGDGGYAILARSTSLMDRITYKLKDSEVDNALGTVFVDFEAGFTVAQLQSWSNAFAPELDAVTNSKIESAELTLNLTLPGGLKASPVTNTINERGGLYTFIQANVEPKYGFRIPNILTALISGQTVGVNAPMDDVITRLTTDTDVSGVDVRPVTPYQNFFEEVVSTKKSFRK